MPAGFSHEHAARLVGHCRDVEHARFLIENAQALGPLYEIISRPAAMHCGEAELAERLRAACGVDLTTEEFRRCLQWFEDAGLSSIDGPRRPG